MCRDDLARKTMAASLLHHGVSMEEFVAISSAFMRECDQGRADCFRHDSVSLLLF